MVLSRFFSSIKEGTEQRYPPVLQRYSKAGYCGRYLVVVTLLLTVLLLIFLMPTIYVPITCTVTIDRIHLHEITQLV